MSSSLSQEGEKEVAEAPGVQPFDEERRVKLRSHAWGAFMRGTVTVCVNMSDCPPPGRESSHKTRNLAEQGCCVAAIGKRDKLERDAELQFEEDAGAAKWNSLRSRAHEPLHVWLPPLQADQTGSEGSSPAK